MHEFSLLTLNGFGLPFFLAHGRWPRLVRELERHPRTVLCLQEVQQNHYLNILLRGLTRYPHHAFRRRQLAPHGGLFTASQLPLRKHDFVPYLERGRWWSAAAGDRYLGKGMLAVHLLAADLPITVLNTHLNANYSGDWRPTNGYARVLARQVDQLCAWVRQQPASSLVVVCGDFNFPRRSHLYRDLVADAGLTDLLADDPRPTYRPFGPIPARFALPIDFVLYRPPAGVPVRARADLLDIEDSRAHHPRGRFLTDHRALTLHVQWP